MSHPGGRPPKFTSAVDMQIAIDKYFADCDPHVADFTYIKTHKDGSQTEEVIKKITDQKPYTMSGLALALDMDRKTLLNYSKKDEFFPTVKKARDKVEAYVESLMLKSNGVVAGVIFNAKNNFDWKDKQETDVNLNTEVKLSDEQAEQLLKARARRSDI
jgi:hypothetical protein